MKTIESLEILFGSRIKVRLMRFFVLNSERDFLFAELTKKNLLKSTETRKELNIFKKAGFIKESKRKNKKYYRANLSFPFYGEIERLVIKSNASPQCKSLTKVKKIGIVKLVLTTGIFLNYKKGKIDLLIVADDISRIKLKRLIVNLEAEVGKELRYMVIGSEELLYRLNMLDRFLLGLFKDPHDIVINKIPKIKKYLNVRKSKK